MITRSKKILFLLTLCILNSFSSGAAVFRHIGVADGLSSRVVFEVDRDSTGFLWLLTPKGIDRYDGSMICHYELALADGTRDNIDPFATMVNDLDNTLWVVLKSGHVYKYDRKKDNFGFKTDISSKVPEIYHATFLSDSTMLLGTKRGLYSMDRGANTQLKALPDRWIRHVYAHNGNKIFAATDKGIAELTLTDSGEIEVTNEYGRGLSMETVTVIDDKVYAGTTGRGVIVYSNGSEHRLPGMTNKPVLVIAPAPDGNLYVGVDGGGLYVYDKASDKLLRHYYSDAYDGNGLSDNSVIDINVGPEGDLWISTFNRGINYLSSYGDELRTLNHSPYNRASIRSDIVNKVMEDADGDLWIATDRGLSMINQKTGAWNHYLDWTDQPATVLALAQTRDGAIWAAGYGMGIYQIDKHRRAATKLPLHSMNSDTNLPFDNIFALMADGNKLWIGGIADNIAIYDTHEKTLRYVESGYVDNIIKGPDGRVWMSGARPLGYVTDKDDHVIWLDQIGDITVHHYSSDISIAPDGSIWMATDGEGVIGYYPKTDSAYVINQGLDSQSISSIVADKDGRIWLATERHLYCHVPTTGITMRIDDVMPSNVSSFLPRAASVLSNGTLVFGSAEGALSFRSSVGDYAPLAAKVIFTDLEVQHRDIHSGDELGILPLNINDTELINLSHRQNSFAITFSAINLIFQHRLRFEYQLQGWEKGWNIADGPSAVKYADLSPGKYTFIVRAIDRWTNKEVDSKKIDINIAKAPWLSWWALCLYVIALAILGWIIVQNVRHKAKELLFRDRLKSMASVAHDIIAPISMIKALQSDVLSDEQLPLSARHKLQQAAGNVDRLHGMISQLIEIQKGDGDDAAPIKISRCDIAECVTDKVDDYTLLAHRKGLTIKCTTPDTPVIVETDRTRFDHIIDNLISNAIKYTENGCIEVSVKVGDGKWSLTVSDTGIGIPLKEQKHIFKENFRASNAKESEQSGTGIGLMLVAKLVVQLGGKIVFDSVEGRGTTFTATFPINVTNDSEIETNANCDVIRDLVLIVEDDIELKDYLTKAFSKDYRVISCSDGEEAYEKAISENPDLVLTDIRMPKMNGDELCRRLKASVETSHIPVILLTGLSDREDILSGLEAGAYDYIVKPFDMGVLRLRVRNIMRSRGHLRKSLIEEPSTVPDNDFTSELDKKFLSTVSAVITREIDNSDFSINDLCREIGMSRTAFYNKIKTLTGTSPNDYIRAFRLSKAKELLLKRSYSIAEVSSMVGFADPKYFSVCFKKQFGCSPSKIGVAE